MKEDHNQVFCHSSVCKEEADLVFFEEKAAFDSNDPGLEISPLGSSLDPKDQFLLSDISSAAEFSHSDPDNSVIKCELHELTVYNVVKDICVDEGARGVDKISIESWTGDPARDDIQEDDDSKLLSEDESKRGDFDGDVADECTTKEKEDIEPIVSDHRKFSSEVDDSKDAFVESTHEQNSQMPSEEANTAEKNAEKLPESVLISEPLHEVENSSDKTSASNAIQVQLPELEDRPKTEDKASNYLSNASTRSDRFTDGETSFSAAGSLSALIAYSGSISLRSDSSTTSTRSFAFPVLQSEWHGSPALRLYYQYIPEGKEFPILCRKLAADSKGWMGTIANHIRSAYKKEDILLDWNEIAENYGYVHVGTCRVSPDHNFLAYTIDISGGEEFVLQIKDLQSDCILPNLNINGVVSLEWAQDSRILFYTLTDQQQRPYRLQSLRLGSDCMDHAALFTENDSNFCLDIASTKDGKFITMNSNSRTSSEVYFINATNPQTGLKKFCNRVSGVQYFLEHHHGYFYVLTNAPIIDDMALPESGNFYLARCRVENSQSTNLQNIIVPSGDIFLKDMDMFNEHLVLFVNKEGSSSICSIPMKTIVSCEKQKDIEDLSPWFFPLPSDMCSVAPGSNHDFMNSIYRVIVSSPVMPDVIIDYDMSRKSSNVVMQEELTNISSWNDNGLEDRQGCEIQKTEGDIWRDVSGIYACESKEVISHDGVRIPLTILYSRKAHQKGRSPALLHAYGAYGEILDKSWCGNRLSLLDRGWAIAFADVRGGGGGPHPSWHRSGSGLNKLNSIRDFISCGQYLVNEGYAHGNKLGAVGISAGSLLVGAAIGLHPGLFQAAVLKVPFLDICNTLLDPTLPLTILDYEEFGNPQIESVFNYILKYSPYDNISHELCFPATLVTASYNDSRVGVWEAAKWVAKIRDEACSGCCGSVILQTDMNGGHFSEGGRLGHCQEAAYEYAFLMKALGDLQRDETRNANEVFGV